MTKVIYSAIFLTDDSRETLLATFQAIHPNVHAHHVTLVFKPNEEALNKLETHLKQEVEVTLLGRVIDHRGDAFVAQIPPDLVIGDQRHHLTFSCADGVTPVYSNEMLKTLTPIVIKPIRLRGEVRHFTK